MPCPVSEALFYFFCILHTVLGLGGGAVGCWEFVQGYPESEYLLVLSFFEARSRHATEPLTLRMTRIGITFLKFLQVGKHNMRLTASFGN